MEENKRDSEVIFYFHKILLLPCLVKAQGGDFYGQIFT